MGERISWWRLPDDVRSAVHTSLGSDVVEAVTQSGGYSPGAAARVRTATGGRAFVKALSNDRHAPSAQSYRREAAIMSHLPADLPVPRLLDVHDDGNWVILVYEDVDGRPPAIPWRPSELDRICSAIADLGVALDPSPWPDAPSFAEVNAGPMDAWRDFAASPPRDLDISILRMVDRLATEGVDLEEVVRGEALLHNDIRSDNILLTPDGRVFFVDWGMPCKGGVWLDLMMFAVTSDFLQSADPDLVVGSHPLTRDIAPSSIDAVVGSAYAAYRRLARVPVNPLVPHGNVYHVACAEASLRWLRRRAARTH